MARTPLTLCYLRQSLDARKQENSIEVQLAAAKAYHARSPALPPWSDALERDFVDIHTDSARTFADRKAGRALLAAAVAGDCVIFSHLDRLGRTIFDMLATIHLMQKRGLKLHILDALGQPMDLDTPFGQMMVAAFAFAATLEKQRIGERTKAAISHLRTIRGGNVTGMCPPGKMRDENKMIVDHPGEQRQIAEAYSLSLRGWSQKQIHAEFRRKGYLTRDGKVWSLTRLQNAIAARKNETRKLA